VTTAPRSAATEEKGGADGEGFYRRNGENGGCFFIRAIRVIRGEKVWKVGREDAQKAQKSEDGVLSQRPRSADTEAAGDEPKESPSGSLTRIDLGLPPVQLIG
jgi:hypothetical protein